MKNSLLALLFVFCVHVVDCNGPCTILNSAGKATDLSGVQTWDANQNMALNLCHIVPGFCGEPQYNAFFQWKEFSSNSCKDNHNLAYFQTWTSGSGGHGSNILLAYQGNPTVMGKPRQAQITVVCDPKGSNNALTTCDDAIVSNATHAMMYTVECRGKIACSGAPAPGPPPVEPTIHSLITVTNYVPSSTTVDLICSYYDTPSDHHLEVAQLRYGQSASFTTKPWVLDHPPECTLRASPRSVEITFPTHDWSIKKLSNLQIAAYPPAGSLSSCDVSTYGECASKNDPWKCTWYDGECGVDCDSRGEHDCEMDLLCTWRGNVWGCNAVWQDLPAIWWQAVVTVFPGFPPTPDEDASILFSQFVPDLTVSPQTGYPSPHARVVYSSPALPPTPAPAVPPSNPPSPTGPSQPPNSPSAPTSPMPPTPTPNTPASPTSPTSPMPPTPEPSSPTAPMSPSPSPSPPPSRPPTAPTQPPTAPAPTVPPTVTPMSPPSSPPSPAHPSTPQVSFSVRLDTHSTNKAHGSVGSSRTVTGFTEGAVGLHAQLGHIPAGTYVVNYQISQDGRTWTDVPNLSELTLNLSPSGTTDKLWLWGPIGVQYPSPKYTDYTVKFLTRETNGPAPPINPPSVPAPTPSPYTPADPNWVLEPEIIALLFFVSFLALTILGILVYWCGFYRKKRRDENQPLLPN